MICLLPSRKPPKFPAGRRRRPRIAACTSCFSFADLPCVLDSCSGKKPTSAPQVRFFLLAQKFAASQSTSFADKVSVPLFSGTPARPHGSLLSILIYARWSFESSATFPWLHH